MSRGKIEMCTMRRYLFKNKCLFLLFWGVYIMNKIMENESVTIEDMIYEVRGVQVMLSSDVAKLY